MPNFLLAQIELREFALKKTILGALVDATDMMTACLEETATVMVSVRELPMLLKLIAPNDIIT